MSQKTFKAKLQFKAEGEGDPGEVKAVFATLNVVDHDGDVTLPGAFVAQQVMIEPWNHNWGEPPVGIGMIREEEGKAVMEGGFFLDTAAGKDHYTVVKRLGDFQEWSYTFDILEAEPGVFNGLNVRYLKRLDVVGVGPVTRGAGIGTRTERIKGGSAAGEKPNGGEGETQKGKPSGVGPALVKAQIELIELES